MVPLVLIGAIAAGLAVGSFLLATSYYANHAEQSDQE